MCLTYDKRAGPTSVTSPLLTSWEPMCLADCLRTIHSHSLTQPFVHSRSHSSTHAATHPLTQPLIHSRSHSSTHAATHSLTQVQKSWPARSCWWRELRRGDCLCGTWAPQHAHEATSRWHGDRQHGGVSDTLIGITPDSNNPRKSVRSVLQQLRIERNQDPENATRAKAKSWQAH